MSKKTKKTAALFIVSFAVFLAVVTVGFYYASNSNNQAVKSGLGAACAALIFAYGFFIYKLLMKLTKNQPAEERPAGTRLQAPEADAAETEALRRDVKLKVAAARRVSEGIARAKEAEAAETISASAARAIPEETESVLPQAIETVLADSSEIASPEAAAPETKS